MSSLAETRTNHSNLAQSGRRSPDFHVHRTLSRTFRIAPRTLQSPPQRRHAAVGAGLIDHAVARQQLWRTPRIGRLLHLEGIEAGADQEVELIAQHVAGGAQRAAKTVASRAAAAPGYRRGRRGISEISSAISARWPSHGSSSATRRSFGQNTPSEPSRRTSSSASAKKPLRRHDDRHALRDRRVVERRGRSGLRRPGRFQRVA